MTGFREKAALPYGRSLDCLNFFLADVKGGLGPYLGIYLLTQQHWNQAAIGVVATVAGIVGLVIHAPVGAFIDATRWKRGVVVAGPYGFVRHPIYAGLLVHTGGAALATGNVLFVAGSLLVTVPVLYLRARTEERMLRADLGAAYDEYAREVGMLVPFIGRT